MKAIPWIVDGAEEYLEGVLNTLVSPQVLEFGSGGSTLWFAQKGCAVTSIEHDVKWYNKVSPLVKDNPQVTLICKPSVPKHKFSDELKESYCFVCDEFENEYFDVILLDGRNRVECFEKCEKKLKKGGLLVLDNSDREEYSLILDAYRSKVHFLFTQEKPNKEKYAYKGWSTSIWVK